MVNLPRKVSKIDKNLQSSPFKKGHWPKILKHRALNYLSKYKITQIIDKYEDNVRSILKGQTEKMIKPYLYKKR